MAFIWPWIAGLFVSLVLGQLITASFLKNLRQWMGNPEKSPPPPHLHDSCMPHPGGSVGGLLPSA